MVVKITQKEIYNSIQQMKETNTQEHGQICHRLDQTNGKVKLNRWIATTALVLVITTIGWCLSSLG